MDCQTAMMSWRGVYEAGLEAKKDFFVAMDNNVIGYDNFVDCMWRLALRLACMTFL
jgi:hypothetical protein